MTILHAIILGIIEGLTEFLPVSSTGHLILASSILKIPSTDFVKSFEIAIQAAAILAVVVLYFQRLVNNTALIRKLVVAFIPTAVVGLVAYKFVKDVLLENNTIVIWSLLIGGAVLMLFERIKPQPTVQKDLREMTYKHALVIGLFQAVAIIPGVSRAAATIIGGLALGFNRRAVVEFSFLLAIPTMFAATGYDLIKNMGSFQTAQLNLLLVGAIVSFITAVFSVKSFLKYVDTRNFSTFGVYRISLAVVAWIILFGL